MYNITFGIKLNESLRSAADYLKEIFINIQVVKQSKKEHLHIICVLFLTKLTKNELKLMIKRRKNRQINNQLLFFLSHMTFIDPDVRDNCNYTHD